MEPATTSRMNIGSFMTSPIIASSRRSSFPVSSFGPSSRSLCSASAGERPSNRERSRGAISRIDNQCDTMAAPIGLLILSADDHACLLIEGVCPEGEREQVRVVLLQVEDILQPLPDQELVGPADISREVVQVAFGKSCQVVPVFE